MSQAVQNRRHELQARVDVVGQRARLLMLLSGLALTVVVVVAALLVLGLADYFTRVEDVGVRIISSLLMVGAIGAAIYFFLAPAINGRLETIRVARLIETRFPQLGDRLTSTLQFLNESEDDPTAGSASLRRAVVAETTAAAQGLNFGAIIRTSGVWKVALPGLALLLIAGGLFAWDFDSSRRAVWRLAVPFSAPAWPRWTNLEIADGPALVSKGSDWRLTVVDKNNRLPGDAEIQYQFADSSSIESRAMTPLSDSLVFQLPAVSRSFRYRVRGGDDDAMAWRNVEVVEPATPDSLVVEVTPPAYLPFTQTVQQEGAVKAIVGSTIRISGTTTKPITACRAETDQQGKRSTHQGAAAGRKFTIPKAGSPPIVVSADGRLTVVLLDDRNVAGATVLHITAHADKPPTVTLQQPRGSQHVTRAARVEVEANVKEDTALQRVELRYRTSDDGPEHSLALQGGDEQPPTEVRQTSQAFTLGWDLETEPDLAVGQTIELHVAAEDYLPNVGESSRVRLTIVSEADMLDRLGRDQSIILNQLEESLAMQQSVRGRLGEIMIQFNDVALFENEHSQRLQSAELSQRQINEKLAGPSNSVLMQVDSLQQRMQQNRVDAPVMQRRLNELRDSLNQLAEGPLPGVAQKLLEGVKSTRLALAAAPDGKAAVTDELRAAASGAISDQNEIVARLEALVGELSHWEDYRRFGRDIRDIQVEQQAIAELTAAGRASALTRDPNDWSLQEIADLRKLALRQSELASRFETLLGRMQATHDTLDQSQPLAAEVLSDAIDVADRFAINGQMREAGRLLGDRNFGEAGDVQSTIDEGLTQMLDALANRREHELSRQGDKLEGAAAADLASLTEKQRLLRDKFKQAANLTDAAKKKRELERLAREQNELAEEAKRLGRRLERLRAEQASNAMQRAGSSMQRAGAAGDAGDGVESQKQAAQAQSDLEQVAREIEQQQQQIKQDLFEQQMAKLKPTIEGFVKRQAALLEELQRLQSLADDQGELSRAQQASARTLARQQRLIAGELGDLAEKIAQAQAFALGLEGAKREMDRVAAQLDRLDLGDSTHQAATSALARLEQILKALEKEAADSNANAGGGAGQGAGGSQGDSIQRLSELKLMHLMQEEINLRTQQLETARNQQGSKLNAEQQQQQFELAQEQGQLAELILEMVKVAPQAPENDPDSLPPIEDEIDKAVQRLLEFDESKLE